MNETNPLRDFLTLYSLYPFPCHRSSVTTMDLRRVRSDHRRLRHQHPSPDTDVVVMGLPLVVQTSHTTRDVLDPPREDSVVVPTIGRPRPGPGRLVRRGFLGPQFPTLRMINMRFRPGGPSLTVFGSVLPPYSFPLSFMSLNFFFISTIFWKNDCVHSLTYLPSTGLWTGLCKDSCTLYVYPLGVLLRKPSTPGCTYPSKNKVMLFLI